MLLLWGIFLSSLALTVTYLLSHSVLNLVLSSFELIEDWVLYSNTVLSSQTEFMVSIPPNATTAESITGFILSLVNAE